MQQLLIESKRDNLLNRFLEYLQGNGIEVTLGQVKSKLLNKFVVEANMHNLSLRSNFYLAGVAKYYFDGSLTTNKDLSLLKKGSWEGEDIQDNWNVNRCAKLNILINVLRNAYIDSVGTQMVEPEDFGELPLDTLLKKYSKEIRKEGGVGQKKKGSELDTNENVGNGYTFEIMYSYEDCQKYNQPTSPGSWCITYGQQHYNYYVKTLNIHYVIFRKNGWEEIQRPQNPTEDEGFTRQKPHDAYGNSLIALLQSNTSPEPVYITSRWNHGYGNVYCEADHAYTKEEFQEITGTSDDDLDRIYKIWKANRTTKKSGGYDKKEALFINRSLKYLQMRINAGENPEKLFISKTHVYGSEKITKGVFGCSANISETTMGNNDKTVYFLFDNGKIVFETATVNAKSFILITNELVSVSFNENKHMIYSCRLHKLISVGGTYIFKRIPSRQLFAHAGDSVRFFEVKQGMMDIALIDYKTMEPIVLPNGESWFNMVVLNGYGYEKKQIQCHVYSNQKQYNFTFVYDLSSKEYYCYDGDSRTFVNVRRPEEVRLVWGDDIQRGYDYFPTICERISDNIFVIDYKKDNTMSYCCSQKQVIRNSEPISIFGTPWFYNVTCNGKFVIIDTGDSGWMISDIGFTKILSFDGRNPVFGEFTGTTYEGVSYVKVKNKYNIYYLLNNDFTKVVVNPFRQDNEDPYGFHGYMFRRPDGSYCFLCFSSDANTENINAMQYRSNDRNDAIVTINELYENGQWVDVHYIPIEGTNKMSSNQTTPVQINEHDIMNMVHGVIKKLYNLL